MLTEHLRVIDTTTFDSWCLLEEVSKKHCKIIDIVGRVIHENDTEIVIALLSDGDEPITEVASFALVPKVSVIERNPA